MHTFPKHLIFLIAIALILILGCKENLEPQPQTFSYEADPEGSWYKGDFHVHSTGASNDTGGDSYPEDIKNKAIERGLDFVVLTDHSNSAGSDPSTTYEDPSLFNMGPEFVYWDEADALSDADFLIVSGSEISPRETIANEANPTGHIGCIPEFLSISDPDILFIDRPMGTVSGGNALDQAQDAGCFTILNHPYGPQSWTKYDWSSYDYQAMEIWNGTVGYDLFDKWAINAWICDLLSGRVVTPIGASDNHRVNTTIPGDIFNPALGYPATYVFAETFDWSAIISGLSSGQVAIGEGDSKLFINMYKSDGSREESLSSAIIRLRGQYDTVLDSSQLTLRRYTMCNDIRPDVGNSVELEFTSVLDSMLFAADPFDIRIDYAVSPGVYFAQLNNQTGHYVAMSRAIIIE